MELIFSFFSLLVMMNSFLSRFEVNFSLLFLGKKIEWELR